MKRSLLVALILILSSGISLADSSLKDSSTPATFVPMKGVPNLYRVSNDLFRSAQPTTEGMKNLPSLGIKTVINLCSGKDPCEIGGAGLAYEHIPMNVWNPKEKQVVQFLQILMNNKNAPVLLHCQHGADRTGTLCAVYRIAVEGWTRDEALKEMIDGGFGFHQIWSYLLSHWIKELDIKKIMSDAGIANPASLVGTRSKDIHVAIPGKALSMN